MMHVFVRKRFFYDDYLFFCNKIACMQVIVDIFYMDEWLMMVWDTRFISALLQLVVKKCSCARYRNTHITTNTTIRFLLSPTGLQAKKRT